ncbi:MAG TPA: tRNA (adenosine(37)-N6)-threonylcarbamoyltransferase complex transferase subunit TsaD [Candidatus Eremiobacteraeota bacterium]|nr:MAG: tRNA N6-adenosine threonylcarbamoyltransferase [bacterium ADurb.Bin363]HPZ09569.1 tRNA (adenosine(37)-N6)-threonylcarbamoyltransferase complex transferase subunit TsaD [Candidatus Eremiobacteraeota bacterium]
MLILGIETSCDETSVAVVEDGKHIRSHIICSQVEFHQQYGGVVPEIASRKHLEFINPAIDEAIKEGGITFGDLSLVAVANGPGLVGALLVGVSAAKAISYALNIPLIGVNHLEGHVVANLMREAPPAFPWICLIVSGGHVNLIEVKDLGHYIPLGKTRDDAAGEAFDKIATVLGLPYPGGPAIEKLALRGNAEAIRFPRAYLEKDSLDFSFSGLKTAVIYYLKELKTYSSDIPLADIAASFQYAITDILSKKALMAAKRTGVKTIALAGGVACNSSLRELVRKKAEKEEINLIYPPPVLCTDNAAMIACGGYYKYLRGEVSSLELDVYPVMELSEK